MLHKRIAVIGCSGEIESSYEKTTTQLFTECGLNTGNLAFWYAMNQHIEGDKTYLGWGTDPNYIKNNFDVIVFPAANQLNPDWDMGILADLFEKAELPLIICGLGVQAKDMSQRISFKPGSKRFMSVVSERAAKVGVRGDFTADVMKANGVNNVEVIGCPSNFISSAPNLGKIQEKKFEELDDVQNLILNLDITPSHQTLIRNAFKWGQGRNAVYVNQAPEALVRLGNGELIDIAQGTLRYINNIVCPHLPETEFKQFVKQNFTVFFSATEWMNQLRRSDLAIGTRMHGNMLAWQAKTPCVLFPHDSRTSELAMLMKLPYVMSNDVKSAKSIEQVLDKLEFHGSDYDTRRGALLDKYINLLNCGNVQVSGSLNNLYEAMHLMKRNNAA